MKYKTHKRTDIPDMLTKYATDRGLKVEQYSPWHFRIFYTAATVDVWTTGKFYVLQSDYGGKAIESGGRKGTLHHKWKYAMKTLDDIIFAAETE